MSFWWNRIGRCTDCHKGVYTYQVYSTYPELRHKTCYHSILYDKATEMFAPNVKNDPNSTVHSMREEAKNINQGTSQKDSERPDIRF